jgi:NAD-dependent deacetylase
MTADGPLARARALVDGADRVVVLTGAGISAESGVPTFRGQAGLWKSYRPEELATPEAFRREPELVWAWYTWRRGLVARCTPNEGHRALARFARRHGRVTLVTQNVDGLHQRAAEEPGGGTADGSSGTEAVLELHGSLLRDRCSGCARRTPVDLAQLQASSFDQDRAEDASPVPRCAACGGLLRPDVVWFGEMLDEATLERAFEAARRAALCLVVGTSSLVHPAASIPLAALAAGRPVVEVNLEPTPLSRSATVSVRGTAGAVLPELLDPLY